MKRALVTGGAGFIGSHVTEALLRAGYQTLVLDNLVTGARENVPAGADFVPADITHVDAIADIARRFLPEVIVHLAAQTNVAASTADPAGDATVNLLGTLMLLRAAVSAGTRKFVFASSSTVYGDCTRQPVREDDPLCPISPYGVSKLAGEHYVRVVCESERLPYIILRFGNVFGPRDSVSSHHVITSFVDALLSRRRPTIEWDGKQTKDYVYVTDIAAAVVAAVDHGHNDVCNIGSGTGVSVKELFRLVCAATDSVATPLYSPQRPGDVRRFIMDCTRAQHLLGWCPTTPLVEALAATVEYSRARAQTTASSSQLVRG